MNDFQPQPTLTGAGLTLRPLQAADFNDLYGVAGDPLLWASHPHKARYQQPVFRQWFASALEGRQALLVIDDTLGVVGSSRFYEYDQQQREVAIGYTFIRRDCWGSDLNRRLKTVMFNYAYEFVDRIWLHIDPDNLRSRRAAEKLGAKYHHTEVKTLSSGTNTYCCYSIGQSDWISGK